MSVAKHFSVDNLPYGIASGGSHPDPAAVTRLGDNVFFLNDLDLDCPPEVKATFSQVRAPVTVEHVMMGECTW